MFAHVKDALKAADHEKEDLRLETIRKIKGLGLNPIHVIHRHGMSEREAKLAEAVLIDGLSGIDEYCGRGRLERLRTCERRRVGQSV